MPDFLSRPSLVPCVSKCLSAQASCVAGKLPGRRLPSLHLPTEGCKQFPGCFHNSTQQFAPHDEDRFKDRGTVARRCKEPRHSNTVRTGVRRQVIFDSQLNVLISTAVKNLTMEVILDSLPLASLEYQDKLLLLIGR